MTLKPFPGMLMQSVRDTAPDLAPGEAEHIIDRLITDGAPIAAERVRLANIGNRALLAAACNELLLRAGSAADPA